MSDGTAEPVDVSASLAALRSRFAGLAVDYESLDRLEDELLAAIDAGTDTAVLETQISHAMGAVLVAQVKGAAWATTPRIPRPVIAINGFPRGQVVDPKPSVTKLRRARVRGIVRDDIERFDLPRRQVLARELAAVKPGGTIASLGRLEASLRALRAAKTAVYRAGVHQALVAFARVAKRVAPNRRWTASANAKNLVAYGAVNFADDWNVPQTIRSIVIGTARPDSLGPALEELA